MNKKRSLFALLVCMLTACTSNAPNPKVLVFGTDPTYPPYESVAPDGSCEGLDIDVAKAIAEKLDRKLVVKQLGFTALILALQQNKVDVVIAGMSMTPSRQKAIEMIHYQGTPIQSLQLAFWGEKPPEVQRLEDLDVVAVMVGSIEEEHVGTVPHITCKSLDNISEIIMDLQYGKSQAALFEPKEALCLSKKFPELQWLEVPLGENHWTQGKGVGMKKGNSALIEQVRSAIEELKAEGALQKIEEKWMGT